jgi:3,4-dihydroxy 2-butanone 4-phosphate synthase / GTP cyclohydrolase II
MARIPDLEDFADKHQLGIVRIADLIQYRLAKELLVRAVSETTLMLGEGKRANSWRTIRYQTDVDGTEYLALVLGKVKAEQPTLVRVQVASALRDVFGAGQSSSEHSPAVWMRSIEEAGEGVFLYVLPPGNTTLLRELPAPVVSGANSTDGLIAEAPLRDFGLGAQVLAHLGIGKIRLLTDKPRRIAGLDGFGMQVVECVASRPSAPVVSIRDSQH